MIEKSSKKPRIPITPLLSAHSVASKSKVAPSVVAAHADSAGSSAESPFYKGGDHWNIDESIGFLIRKLKNSLHRHMDSQMLPCGLTDSQWGPLLLIANGKGDTSGMLARELDLDAGAMTRMIDRLEAKGMLNRIWSADDRRVANLELTAQGLAVTRRVPDAIAAVLNHHLRGFAHKDVQQISANLRRMLENGSDPLLNVGSIEHAAKWDDKREDRAHTAQSPQQKPKKLSAKKKP